MNLRDIPDQITLTSTIQDDLVIAGIVLLKPSIPKEIQFKTFHERYREALYKAICVSVANGIVTTEAAVAEVPVVGVISRDYLIAPAPEVVPEPAEPEPDVAVAPEPAAPEPEPEVAIAPEPAAPEPEPEVAVAMIHNADIPSDPVVVLDEPAEPIL